MDLAAGASGIIAGTEPYKEHVLKQLPVLRVISRLGIGLDNIDLNTAESLGIKIFKTQTTPALAVADLTVGLMIDVARKISGQVNGLVSGTWKKQMGNLLSGETR